MNHWFPLALLCAFALATADTVTKGTMADYTGRELVVVRFGVTGLLLLPLLWLHPLPPVPALFWGWMALLVPLEILAMWLYMQAICSSPLSHTLPYLAFTPVFTTLTGWWVLGEQVSTGGFAGVSLVVAGAYALNVDTGGGTAPRALLEPFRAMLRERGARLMLMVAAIYGVTSVGGKAAMAFVPPFTFGAFYFVLIGAATLVVFGARRPASLRVLWRRPAAHLVMGLAMGVMVVSHFLAISGVEVAYMIAVKRTSMLFGMAYGAWLFHERGLRRHLLAGAMMVAGVGLIVS